MDMATEEQNSEVFLSFTKRTLDPLMADEELCRTKKRKPDQRMSSQTPPDQNKDEEQQEKEEIEELESKNTIFLLNYTDLNSPNKMMPEDSAELPTEPETLDSSSSQDHSTKEAVQQILKSVPATGVLNTKTLVALWEEISSIPLPQCKCSKSQAGARRRMNHKTKKYKAYTG